MDIKKISHSYTDYCEEICEVISLLEIHVTNGPVMFLKVLKTASGEFYAWPSHTLNGYNGGPKLKASIDEACNDTLAELFGNYKKDRDNIWEPEEDFFPK